MPVVSKWTVLVVLPQRVVTWPAWVSPTANAAVNEPKDVLAPATVL